MAHAEFGGLTVAAVGGEAVGMASRMLALVPDETAREQIDLLRALYDRERVEDTPPHIPLTDEVDAFYPLDELTQLMEIILSLFQPFMLELAHPTSWFDGERHLLQIVAEQGEGEAQRLAGMLYRDLFPEFDPKPPFRSRSPIERTALTLGRFDREAEAQGAAAALAEQRYFLVMTHAGIFDGDAESGVWRLRRALPLGGMIVEE